DFAVVISVLCDLRLQGWTFKTGDGGICLSRPGTELDPEIERERIRRMHYVNRSVQLMKDSVRSFVRSLEKKRLGPHGWVSIFSLMRDGRELASKLRQAAQLSTDEQRCEFLRTTIRPYVQIVSGGELCEHTGLQLSEIWRYFRHTWVNEYQSVPGRNVMVLVR